MPQRAELHDRRCGFCQTSSAARKYWLLHEQTYARSARLTMRNGCELWELYPAHDQLRHVKSSLSRSHVYVTAHNRDCGLPPATRRVQSGFASCCATRLRVVLCANKTQGRWHEGSYPVDIGGFDLDHPAYAQPVATPPPLAGAAVPFFLGLSAAIVESVIPLVGTVRANLA